jgi:signal peptidase I
LVNVLLKNYSEIALFEDILEKGLSLRVRVTGRSMAPFLRGGEILTIKKEPQNALRKGDLIFFKNGQGTPLLHRIVKKRKSFNEKITFRTKGDAFMAFDEPVKYHRVLGKVIRIEKTSSETGSKEINMESLKWRMINAVIAWMSLFKSYFHYVLSFLLKRNLIIEFFHRRAAECAEKNFISILLRGQKRNN